MNFIKYIDRLKTVNKLIKQKKTGSPTELANKLNLSRSQLYETIDLLKIYGAPIKYSRKLRSFYYEEFFELEIDFNLKVLSEKNTKNIYGGNVEFIFRNFIPSDEIGSNKYIFTIAN